MIDLDWMIQTIEFFCLGNKIGDIGAAALSREIRAPRLVELNLKGQSCFHLDVMWSFPVDLIVFSADNPITRIGLASLAILKYSMPNNCTVKVDLGSQLDQFVLLQEKWKAFEIGTCLITPNPKGPVSTLCEDVLRIIYRHLMS